MKRIITSAIFCIGFICGCDVANTNVLDDACNIYLNADLDREMISKAPYIGTDPSNNPFHALVCASTISDSFPNNMGDGKGVDGQVGKHIETTFQSKTNQLINGVYYPKPQEGQSATPVYFVGLHPQVGWNFNSDYNEATYTFDGNDDILFAVSTQGEYPKEEETRTNPELDFKHLLTHLKIEMIAESEAVRDAWQNITSMTIESQNQVIVDLIDGTNTIRGDQDSEMYFYRTGNDEVFPATGGYQLDYRASEQDNRYVDVAYTLCAPVEATVKDPYSDATTTEYTINLTTPSRTIKLSIDLKGKDGNCFEGNTAGYQFNIRMLFRMGNIIAISTGIEQWKTGGTGSGNITEETDEYNPTTEQQ